MISLILQRRARHALVQRRQALDLVAIVDVARAVTEECADLVDEEAFDLVCGECDQNYGDIDKDSSDGSKIKWTKGNWMVLLIVVN